MEQSIRDKFIALACLLPNNDEAARAYHDLYDAVNAASSNVNIGVMESYAPEPVLHVNGFAFINGVRNMWIAYANNRAGDEFYSYPGRRQHVDVKNLSFNWGKIQLIKEVRDVTGLGLQKSKEMVENEDYLMAIRRLKPTDKNSQ